MEEHTLTVQIRNGEVHGASYIRDGQTIRFDIKNDTSGQSPAVALTFTEDDSTFLEVRAELGSAEPEAFSDRKAAWRLEAMGSRARYPWMPA